MLAAVSSVQPFARRDEKVALPDAAPLAVSSAGTPLVRLLLFLQSHNGMHA
jgi:hypothetical protein